MYICISGYSYFLLFISRIFKLHNYTMTDAQITMFHYFFSFLFFFQQWQIWIQHYSPQCRNSPRQRSRVVLQGDCRDQLILDPASEATQCSHHSTSAQALSHVSVKMCLCCDRGITASCRCNKRKSEMFPARCGFTCKIYCIFKKKLTCAGGGGLQTHAVGCVVRVRCAPRADLWSENSSCPR